MLKKKLQAQETQQLSEPEFSKEDMMNKINAVSDHISQMKARYDQQDQSIQVHEPVNTDVANNEGDR